MQCVTFKRFLIMLLGLTVTIPMLIASYTQATVITDAHTYAETLYELGLIAGTGTDSNGKPQFALDRQMTRNEAIVMLSRLLGAENHTAFSSYTSPFVDVPTWASNHVGYAYAIGMTKGMSDTQFGGDTNIDQRQFCALILRALGYSEKANDFTWAGVVTYAKELGLVKAEQKGEFTRGDAFQICYNALTSKVKNGQITLLQILNNRNLISDEQIRACSLSVYKTGMIPYKIYTDVPSVLNVFPNSSVTYENISDAEYKYYHDRYSCFFSANSPAEIKMIQSAYSDYLQANGYVLLFMEDYIGMDGTWGENTKYAFLSSDKKYILLTRPGGMYDSIFVNIYTLKSEGEPTPNRDYPDVPDCKYPFEPEYYALQLLNWGFKNTDFIENGLAPTTHTFTNPKTGTTVTFNSKVETITSTPDSIETSGDLQRYLKNNMSTLETPIGEKILDFDIWEIGDVLEIKIENYIPWYSLASGRDISETDRKETLRILRNFMEDVYSIAIEAFPETKIRGKFYISYYKYPHLKVGLESTTALSWLNYTGGFYGDNDPSSHITEFHWDTTYDDYIFDF